MSLANGLSVLLIFSKNQLLVLLIFAIVLCISMSFISALIFLISFFLLTLRFFVLFLVALGVRLGCLFDVFLVSWGRLAFWWTSLSTAFTESHQFGVVLFSFVSMCILISFFISSGFPCGSAGKESACNVGDLGSIPGLGRCPGQGKGYPLQYSVLENSMDLYSPWGRKESEMTERLALYTFKFRIFFFNLPRQHFLQNKHKRA